MVFFGARGGFCVVLRSGSEEFLCFGLELSIDCPASSGLCTDLYVYVTMNHSGS